MRQIKIAIVLVVLMIGNSAMAQLMPQFSQYMFNDYALNPAIGGTHDYWQIKTNYRYQWQGVQDAPKTYLLSAYGPHKTLPMGYGGYIYNDVTGPISNIGAYGSYAYNIQISGDMRLSMGLFAGIIQQKVDFTSIEFDDFEPLVGDQDKYNRILPDASVGAHLYTSQWFAGFSANHLLFNNLTLPSTDSSEVNDDRMKMHIFIQGGYKYNLNRNFDLEGSALIKTVFDYDFMTDINVRAIYQKIVWGGLGVRYNFKEADAIIINVGYNYSDLINIGYSYDVTLSNMNTNSNGSHEIMIGVKFQDIRQSRSRRKIR